MGILEWFRKRQPSVPALQARPPALVVEAWRRILVNEKRPWVLFHYGTCVLLPRSAEDLRAQAVDLMLEWGPVYPGSPAGDFTVVTLRRRSGWLVACHHPDICTYVAPEEIPRKQRTDVIIGVYARRKRHRDASDLAVIHIEDKRSAA